MESSLENLYQVFTKYRLRPNIAACPCCVTESDKERLQKKELRKLTADDLEKYIFKAVTTWGDEYDLKHFLPRILELMDELPLVSGMIFIQLESNHWDTWPSHEKDAIVAYLESRVESLRHELSQRLTDGESLETFCLESKIEDITDFLNNE